MHAPNLLPYACKTWTRDLAIAKRDLAVAEAAANRTGEVQSESDRAALASAEQAVEDARDVVKLIQAESDATWIHETVVRYTEIAKALGPEGVRAKMLADGLRKLNAGLTAIAKESGWPVTASIRQRRHYMRRTPGATVFRVGTVAGASGNTADASGHDGFKGGGFGPGGPFGRQQPQRLGIGLTARCGQDQHGYPALRYWQRTCPVDIGMAHCGNQ